MKYLAAYMLAVLGGKTAPSAADVKSILDSCGIDADSATLDRLMSAVEGKDINELVAEGMSKLSSVPSGGGGGGGDAPAAAAKEESDEEEEAGMDFDLFD
jgi:large subunit ribosomal protein LP2